jgi:hypothetical protein
MPWVRVRDFFHVPEEESPAEHGTVEALAVTGMALEHQELLG